MPYFRGRWGEAREPQEYDALFGDHWFVQLEWDTRPAGCQGLALCLGMVRGRPNACILQQEDRLVLKYFAAQQGFLMRFPLRPGLCFPRKSLCRSSAGSPGVKHEADSRTVQL